MRAVPPHNNPARTAEHHMRMAGRRAALIQTLHQIIPQATPFVWEVGCGHGHFLAAYAQAHPDVLFIGIDLVTERIDRALRKRDRARLPNLHFIQAEALLFIASLPPGSRLRDVFVLFPDPWPKQRHRKNRVLQANFLTAVAKYADPACRLHFRTDFAPYFAEAAQTLAAHPQWTIVPDAIWPFEFTTVFQSRAADYQSVIAQFSPPTGDPLAVRQ